MVRIRPALIVLAALPVVLALPASAAPVDAAKKRSCKSKKEARGCRLPKGAAYADISGDTTFNVGRRVVGNDPQPYNAAIGVTVGTGACAPREDDVAPQSVVGIRKRPRVGKTYKGKRTEPNPPADQDVSRVDVVSGKVKVVSARKVRVSVKGTIFFVNRPQPYRCDFKIKKTLRRTALNK